MIHNILKYNICSCLCQKEYYISLDRVMLDVTNRSTYPTLPYPNIHTINLISPPRESAINRHTMGVPLISFPQKIKLLSALLKLSGGLKLKFQSLCLSLSKALAWTKVHWSIVLQESNKQEGGRKSQGSEHQRGEATAWLAWVWTPNLRHTACSSAIPPLDNAWVVIKSIILTASVSH